MNIKSNIHIMFILFLQTVAITSCTAPDIEVKSIRSSLAEYSSHISDSTLTLIPSTYLNCNSCLVDLFNNFNVNNHFIIFEDSFMMLRNKKILSISDNSYRLVVDNNLYGKLISICEKNKAILIVKSNDNFTCVASVLSSS
jgi:hypothetical protein